MTSRSTAADVRLWYLPVERTLVQGGEAVLSADERARADRFVVEDARNRFVIARASLRRILAEYLHRRPESIGFSYGTHGKPEVPESGLSFSVSHSRDLVVIGVARIAIGVDVEHLDNAVDFREIARQFFARAEAEDIDSMSEPNARRTFFRYWTCKEAVAKAIGRGLGIPFDTLRVHASAGAPIEVSCETKEGVDRWWVHSFAYGERYVGSIASRRRDLRIAEHRDAHAFGAVSEAREERLPLSTFGADMQRAY